MAIRQRKKRDWFDRGAAAYALVRAEQLGEAVYPCPICLTLFTVDALADGRLSSEHVPPECVGGHELVLTCKRCNNSAGTKLDADAAVKELVIQVDFSNNQERKAGEIAASTVEINCLEDALKKAKCDHCKKDIQNYKKEVQDYRSL